MARRIPVSDIRQFLTDAFAALGASDRDAATVADVLVTADRFGLDTHGVQRLGYYADRIRNGVTLPRASHEVIRETPSAVVIDGHHGLGHVIAEGAMARAIAKAKRVGIGAAAVRNSTHYGMAGFYALQAVDAGCIGLATTNARPCAAPTHGLAPTYGTNPLAFGAPSDGTHPFLYDAAMTIVQRGTVEVAAREGRPMADGVAIDTHGESLTDPSTLLAAFESGDAALLPIGGDSKATGGHKGFGLAMAMEILNSALQDGTSLTALGGADREGGWAPYRTGHFFLAIDPEGFLGGALCRRVVDAIQRELRGSRPAPGHDRVRAAGDREWEAAAERDRDGVPLSDPVLDELSKCAVEIGIQQLIT